MSTNSHFIKKCGREWRHGSDRAGLYLSEPALSFALKYSGQIKKNLRKMF